MKKKFLAVMMALTLAFSVTGCADDEWDEEYGYDDDGDYDDYYEDDEYYDEEEGGGEVVTKSGVDNLTGLEMTVNNSTGQLTVNRTDITNSGNMGDENAWTIFVYLCGTDLESDGGAGTDDLSEMLYADGSDNVRFVVETGGTSEWNMSEVDSDKRQRFVVQSGDIELVDEQALANMGESSTLEGFVKWGIQTYPSEHMGLVLWNHGGGSITGVCFDELEDADSLSLTELDQALYNATTAVNRRFDFIGFDACLMGTVETANVLATYADYMYGSEETEPGSGWDYSAIGSFLAKNPDANGAELGREVCDSFLAACKAQNDDDLTTLAVIDLSKMDNLLVAFNTFANEMYQAGQDSSQLADMVRGINNADNFGGNNKSEGYTNMVDMGGIIDACSQYAPGSDAARKALKDTVVYSVSGSTHVGCSGLAMYYPLCVQGSNELGMFSQICVSPYYLSFVDSQNQTGAGVVPDDGYDDDQWFGEDGEWTWGGDEEDENHWDYLDNYEQTGHSQYITFAKEPYVDDEGYYTFTLDENGINNAADVLAFIYEISADETEAIELGETFDVSGDWSTGTFTDNFDGYWLSLPDGQNLATYFVEISDDYVIYTSPILLNNEETNLRLKQNLNDGSVVIEGAWAGIDECGAADRNIVKLQNGDTIVPLYYSYNLQTDEESTYTGYEYKVSGNVEIVYGLLESGDYDYAFCIDDIYGDYYDTDYVTFNVSEDGEVSFYTE